MIWSFPPWKNSRRCDSKAPTFPTILARTVVLKSWNQLLWNIYPRKDAGVIGVPDEDFGELPRAFVVKAHGSNVTGELVIILRAVFLVHIKKWQLLPEEAICQEVAARVAAYKQLKGGVVFLEVVENKLFFSFERDAFSGPSTIVGWQTAQERAPENLDHFSIIFFLNNPIKSNLAKNSIVWSINWLVQALNKL